jgi:hypothetical protein
MAICAEVLIFRFAHLGAEKPTNRPSAPIGTALQAIKSAAKGKREDRGKKEAAFFFAKTHALALRGSETLLN